MTAAKPKPRPLQWGDIYLDHKTGNVCKWFPVHEGQAEVLNSEARFIAALGGVHSGKTSVGCLWLQNEIYKHGGQGEFLIVAPTYGIALSSTLEAWKKSIAGTTLKGKTGRYVRDNANPHYQLATGGKIYFKSAEADWEGLKPQAALLDEGGKVPVEVFHAVKRRLDGIGGRCFISTTPYLEYDWIPKLIMAEADKKNPMYFYRTFPTRLNPTHNKAAIAEAKRVLPDWEYKMNYEGVFGRPPGAVYDFTTADGASCFVDVPPEGLPQAAAYYAAIDPGGTDPTAALVGLLDDNDCMWVFWEHYQAKEDVITTIDKLTEWDQAFRNRTGHEVKTWWCDHRPELIRALRSKGLRCKPACKGAESIPLGISLVRARIRQGKLKIIRKSCPALIEEAKQYRYPMSEGQTIGNRPIDKNNHSLDCLRYLCLGLRGKIGKQARKEYIPV